MSSPPLQLLVQDASIPNHMATASGPGFDPPAAKTSMDIPAPFMRVPREIRDAIYRFLLSAKYTQRRWLEFDIHSKQFLPVCFYNYGFHTSILSTNRQIYHEASNIFQMENLFVRVNTLVPGPLIMPVPETSSKADYGFALPMFSDSSNDDTCTCHVMEIALFSDLVVSAESKICHFIFTCDDLPLFCRGLLGTDPDQVMKDIRLQRTTLQVTIGNEVLYPSIHERPGKFKNAVTKIAAAYGEDRINTRIVAIGEGPDGGGDTTASRSMEAEVSPSEPPILTDTPRLRRLLEPLRAIHGIGFSHIDAPISEWYRQDILNSLQRARSNIVDFFPLLVSAYEEAITAYAAGFFHVAIKLSKGTLEVWENAKSLKSDAATTVPTGPFAGLTFAQAWEKMTYTLYRNLVRAYLNFPENLLDLRIARALAQEIVKTPGDNAHERARSHYLEVEVWEALDRLGEYRDHHYMEVGVWGARDWGQRNRHRSDALRDVIGMLKEALKHEPGNLAWQEQLERREKEKADAHILEMVMEMERDEGEVQSRGPPVPGKVKEFRWRD